MEFRKSANAPIRFISPACLKRGIVLLVFLLCVSAPSYAYSINVYSQSQGYIGNNGYVYIDPNSTYNWPMPDLTISFTGLSSCDSVSLDIKMAWNDANTTYQTQYDTGTVTMQGTSAWFLDGSSWGLPFGSNNHSEGGYATISYQINGAAAQYFYFNIGGLNPSKTVVGNFDNSLAPPVAPTPPWFWGNILAQESQGQGWAARQYYVNNCLVPDPINVNDCPLVVSNPDGIGISQVDGVENPGNVDDSVYWNFEENIIEGMMILNGKASESQNNWTNNYETLSHYTDPRPYDSKNPYTYCDFVTNTQPLGNHSFGDADWIQDYNGHSNQHWYLWWTSTGWVFKYTQTGEKGYNYVPAVCDLAPY